MKATTTNIIDIFNTDLYASKNYGLFGYVDICKHNGIFSAIEYMQEVLLHSLNHRDLSDEDKAALRFESDLLEDYYNTVIEYCEENDIMTAEEIDCTTMCDVLSNF